MRSPYLLALLLAGCSRGGLDDSDRGELADLAAPPERDLAGDVADLRAGPDLAAPPDLTALPTAEQCLEGWRNYGGRCPAPTISESYVGRDCVGTTGWFILGSNFQLEQHNTGIADYGPQSFGANGNQKHWNIITPTKLCVTVAAQFADTWVGKTIYVKNPDGKQSNSVVVTNKL